MLEDTGDVRSEEMFNMLDCFLALFSVDIEDSQAGNTMLQHGTGTGKSEALGSASNLDNQLGGSDYNENTYLWPSDHIVRSDYLLAQLELNQDGLHRVWVWASVDH